MPLDPLVTFEPAPGGLQRLRARLHRRRRRRRVVAILAAAVGVAALGRLTVPASQPPPHDDDGIAARVLLDGVEHPAMVAWGRAEPAPRPRPTRHPSVVRLSPAED